MFEKSWSLRVDLAETLRAELQRLKQEQKQLREIELARQIQQLRQEQRTDLAGNPGDSRISG